MNNGFVIIHRKIMNTSFYKKPLVCRLAEHCIYKANHKKTKIIFNSQEMELDIGQFICGRSSLSQETGISQQTIRTSLKILENIGFLTSKTTNKFTIITVIKYDDYQIKKENQPAHQPSTNHQLTINQPSTNHQLTTDNNDNNNNNDKKKEIVSEKASDFLSLWNSLIEGKLSRATLTAKRKIAIRARLKDNGDIAYWESVIKKLLESKFCLGDNDRGWKADIDFLLKPDTHIKVIEGKYSNNGYNTSTGFSQF